MKRRLTLLAITIFLLFFYSCNSIKIGDTIVTFQNDEILADNFPLQKSDGFGMNFGAFSFEKLDKFVYETAKETSLSKIYIAIRYYNTDQYGNKQRGEKITIGYIDANEAKKHHDFTTWNRSNKTYNMWSKDLDKYNNVRDPNSSTPQFSVKKAYKPNSIR